ncbi:MAG: hypothetical protein ABFD89_10725 [Bryobacteraceae bacterium]
MTIKRAALLAAVATTLSFACGLASLFLAWVPIAAYQHSSPFNYLLVMVFNLLILLVLGAALPVFFFLLYRSRPLLSIPSSLKKAAWAAAIASGLLVSKSVFLFGNGLLARAQPAGDAAQSMGHPIVWALLRAYQLVVSPSISLIAALTLLLFFVVVARSETGAQTVPLGLRRAAMYACVVATLSAAMIAVSMYVVATLPHSYPKALHQAGAGTSAWWIWNVILERAITVCDQIALAVFFLTFFLKLPAPQSSLWVRSGE